MRYFLSFFSCALALGTSLTFSSETLQGSQPARPTAESLFSGEPSNVPGVFYMESEALRINIKNKTGSLLKAAHSGTMGEGFIQKCVTKVCTRVKDARHEIVDNGSLNLKLTNSEVPVHEPFTMIVYGRIGLITSATCKFQNVKKGDIIDVFFSPNGRSIQCDGSVRKSVQ